MTTKNNVQENNPVSEQESQGVEMGNLDPEAKDTAAEVAETEETTHVPSSGLVKTNLLIDMVALLLFLVIQEQRATGLVIHEWGGLLIAAIVMVHLLLHWTWIANATQRFFGSLPAEVRLNYVINVLLFFALTTVVFSGLMMSRVAVPFLADHSIGRFFWRWLHTTASDVIFWLIALHVALHWGWIVNAVKLTLRALFTRSRKDPSLTAAATQTPPLSESK